MQMEEVIDRHMFLLAEVESLKTKPLPEIREAIATKVSVYFNKGLFDKVECELAFDIIRMLAKDIEVRVRKTLSENLKNNNNLPRDIALKLAKDVLEVSLPMLEFSSILTDQDLIEIINDTKQIEALLAISRRSSPSENLSGALVSTANEDVINSLFLNNSARISQASLDFAFNKFKHNSKIVGSLISRSDLAVSVVDKILQVVSASVRDELVQNHNLSEEKAAVLISHAKEKVALGILNDAKILQNKAQKTAPKFDENIAGDSRIENLVNNLFKEGRLTESLIMRSICEGNLLFFEISLARRAGIPTINARTLMQDGNASAKISLWRRAKMPESTFDAMNIIINFAIAHSKEARFQDNYRRTLLEYIQERGFERTTPLMTYVMALIASKVQIKDII